MIAHLTSALIAATLYAAGLVLAADWALAHAGTAAQQAFLTHIFLLGSLPLL